MSALTSDVEVVAAGGEVVGLVVGDALVPADVIPADGGKVEEAVRTLHHWRLAIIWQKQTQKFNLRGSLVFLLTTPEKWSEGNIGFCLLTNVNSTMSGLGKKL